MPTPETETTKLETMVLLTAKHFMASKILSKRTLALGDGTDFSSWVRQGTEDVVLMLHTYVWAQECKHVDCEWPTTWWDHFKQTYMHKVPAWLRRRLKPVQTTKVSLSSWEGYPEVRGMREFHKPVRYAIKEVL